MKHEPVPGAHRIRLAREVTGTITVSDVLEEGSHFQLDHEAMNTRALLIEVLAGTKWVRKVYKTAEDWATVCRRLGVSPEILRDAIATFRTVHIDNRRRHIRPDLSVRLNALFRRKLVECAKENGMIVSKLVHGMVHEYLHGRTEPEPYVTKDFTSLFAAGERTHVDTRVYRVALLPAAALACSKRAAAQGIPMGQLMRGLFFEVLTGKRKAPREYSYKELRGAVDNYLIPSGLVTASQSRSQQTERSRASAADSVSVSKSRTA